MLAVTVSKRLSVPIPPFLEIHCAADVLFGLITYDFGMINDNNPAFLKKITELALRCRHRNKFLLSPPSEGEEE